jgi:uncharacterized small protein (TIGR04563 family)
MSAPKRKVTLYFNAAMLAETQREAIRQDRSISWIIQAAWKIARDEIRRLPGVGGVLSPVGATPAPTRDTGESPATTPAPTRVAENGTPARRTARE